MIYIDSGAAVKLVRDEAGSAALQSWLDIRSDALVATSEIALTEVLRVVRRNNHDDQGMLVDADRCVAELAGAHDLLDRLALITLDRDTLRRAAGLGAPMVRALDAIHLVSALEWPAGSVQFVTYDRRLAAAAADTGMTVVSPL